MSKIKLPPFHPLLFGVYPALALMAYNLGQINPGHASRSVFMSLVAAAALYVSLWLVLRNPQRAALAASLLVILFYSYGHVYDRLLTVSIAGFVLGRHRYLVLLWGVLALAGFYAIVRTRKDLANLNRVVAVISIVAVAFPIFQFGQYEVRAEVAERQVVKRLAGARAVATSAQFKPDIYYIILDGYARHDIMQQDWSFDDHEFLDGLRSLGFVIADCSQSNYPMTELSIPSTLNIDWVSNLCPECKPGTHDFTHLWATTRHNAVRSFLESMGYRIVAFETGFAWLEWNDADVYFKANPAMIAADMGGGRLNAFEALLLKTTALRPLIDIQQTRKLRAGNEPALWDVDRFPDYMFRVRVLNALTNLDTVPTGIAGPKFVYAHILSPHTPYVFGKNGEMVDLVDSELSGDAYKAAYSNQAYYVSNQVLKIVRHILETSPQPPVIILQSDHGNSINRVDRPKNLNAFYLPYGKNNLVYPTLTNINTFQIVFGAYFNIPSKLLADQVYINDPETPFNLTLLPSASDSCPVK